MPSTSPPLIGITSSSARNKDGNPLCQVGQAYCAALQLAGGVPMILPVGLDGGSLSAALEQLDGVLLSGGGDIDPQLYGGEPHPKVYNISSERDRLELALFEMALSAGKPLLAICRGIQVMNVALGGTLHTHLPDQVKQCLKHDWFPGYPRDKLAHTVSIKCDSLLDEIYDVDELPVNSLHHQGIARVAQGLEAIAYAPDGLVEGVVVREAWFALGVQWHPECLPDDPGTQRLFRSLIEACTPQA